jgi:hypothetical protein
MENALTLGQRWSNERKLQVWAEPFLSWEDEEQRMTCLASFPAMSRPALTAFGDPHDLQT